MLFYLQDILVRPAYQSRHIGEALLNDCLERTAPIRHKVQLTDNEERQRTFYESMGFVNRRRFLDRPLNVYVQIKGLADPG